MTFMDMMRRHEARANAPAGDYESYYEAEHRLKALGITLPPDARILELQAPWGKMSVDVLTEVLIPAGFVHADETAEDSLDAISRAWQANRMDSQFSLAASEAISVGAAYWVVAPSDTEGGVPSIRALPSNSASVRVDHLGRVYEGVAVYQLPSDGLTKILGATYYTPEGVQYWRRVDGGQWEDTGEGRMDAYSIPTIIPMFNKARLKDTYGRSDLAELTPIIDAASRTLTNIAAGQEVAMWPLRVLFGDGISEALKVSPKKLAGYIGSLLGGPTGGDAKQLTGADVTPVLNVLQRYALQVSAMTGIPPSMMGVSSDSNPTSAEALRVAKDRLIMRAENKQRMFADALEQVGELVAEMMGCPVPEPERLELQWLDAAAPSVSAQQANALSAFSQGVISARTARQFLRLTPEQSAYEDARERDVDTMSGMDLGQDTPQDDETQEETTGD